MTCAQTLEIYARRMWSGSAVAVFFLYQDAKVKVEQRGVQERQSFLTVIKIREVGSHVRIFHRVPLKTRVSY